MALDRTAADNILKNLYLGPIRQQLNQGRPILAELEKNTDMVEGKQIVLPIQVGRNQGIGARAEDGSLPTARAAEYAQATEWVKYLYGRIEITIPAIKSMKSDRGSFARAVQSETKTITENMKEDVDRQVVTNDTAGKGALATTGTTSASTTVTISGGDATTARKLVKGLYIDIIDNDDDSVVSSATGRKITAVTGSPVTSITIDGAAVTTDSTHRIVRAGNWKNELIGLEGIISDTGTLHGVNPSTHDVWKATVDSTGGALSEDLMQKMVDSLDIVSSDEGLRILVEHTQQRKFAALQVTNKRYVNTTTLKGGYSAITFNENIPLIRDKFVAPTKMFFVNFKELFMAEASDWEWADDDGAVLSRVSGKASYEAFILKYANLVTTRRNAHGVLTGLST